VSRAAKRSREIFVVVTNRCNLRCSYCYEVEKDTAVISPEIIKKKVSGDIKATRSRADEFYLVFHGGEPFLAYEEMKEVAEWAWNTYPDLDLTCIATTNGTILDSEMKTWLLENKQRFIPILSLDGRKDDHNLNRPGSWERIDRDFFRNNWPQQAVKMTVAPNTLEVLAENVIALHEDGFLVNPGLAKEAGWVPGRDLPVFAGELKKLAAYYLANPDRLPCDIFNINLSDYSPQVRVRHNRACGAGGKMIAFDTEGRPYPCHTFIGQPGEPYRQEEMEQAFQMLEKNDGAELSPGCANCPVYPSCSPCYGLNYAARGSMADFDETMCDFTKIRVLATADMFAQMLHNPSHYRIFDSINPAVLPVIAAGIKEIFANNFITTINLTT